MSSRKQFIFAVVVFGTLGPFIRQINLPPTELALYRAILAAGFLSFYLIIKQTAFDFKQIKKEMVLLFFSGAAMALNWIFLFKAFNHTTVSLATLSYYFAPVIVILVSTLIFKEAITTKKVICFIASTMGLILMTDIGESSGSQLKGILFGLTAAFFYSIVILFNKFIKNVPAIQKTLLQFIAAIVVLLPYVLITTGINITSINGSGLISLLIVGLFHTGFTYVLFFGSVKELSGHEVSLLSYIDPLVAVIVSIIVLNESILPIQLLGGAMIIGFTLINETEKKEKTKNNNMSA
ncbi:MAG: EamA family transporter [Peptostreptococcaceae bacterium]|nr:EamA family transporter [Peptostreptococcaceae bacterium]